MTNPYTTGNPYLTPGTSDVGLVGGGTGTKSPARFLGELTGKGIGKLIGRKPKPERLPESRLTLEKHQTPLNPEDAFMDKARFLDFQDKTFNFSQMGIKPKKLFKEVMNTYDDRVDLGDSQYNTYVDLKPNEQFMLKPAYERLEKQMEKAISEGNESQAENIKLAMTSLRENGFLDFLMPGMKQQYDIDQARQKAELTAYEAAPKLTKATLTKAEKEADKIQAEINYKTKEEARKVEKHNADLDKQSADLYNQYYGRYVADERYKQYQVAKISLDKLNKAVDRDDAAGNFGTIYLLMGVLEPGGRVTEGEFTAATALQGLMQSWGEDSTDKALQDPEKRKEATSFLSAMADKIEEEYGKDVTAIRGYIKKLETGVFLSPTNRANIKAMAKDIFESQQTAFRNYQDETAARISYAKHDPLRVLGPEYGSKKKIRDMDKLSDNAIMNIINQGSQ